MPARSSQPNPPALGIGQVGYAFMGAAHSRAWATVDQVFDVPLLPRMNVLVGRDEAATRFAARRYGWHHVETDWHTLLERDDVQLIDICTPGDTHAEIAIAALDAGKHVLCEKPLANSLEQAEAMTAAAARAAERGIRAMVGFNYRRVPAIALARQLVEQGRIGRLRHVRAAYLQDWLTDVSVPLTWRLQAERAGSGALGDIAAHAVDLAQYLSGEHLAGVSGQLATFVPERPTSDRGDAPTGPVTVDDAAVFTGRLASGALASFEATRVAAGRKNALTIELNGELGSLSFNLEQLNELSFYDRTESETTAGFRRILVTEPSHPYLEGWWPPGHVLGWEHTFVHEVRDLLIDIAGDDDPEPSFADGLQVQRVLDAVAASAAHDSAWTKIQSP
jgi:predicted dehydrogenase